MSPNANKGVDPTPQEAGDRKEAEERISKSEALLSRAEKIANVGSWELDLRSDVLTWSENMFCVLGLDPRKVAPGMGLFYQMIHPDDRERIRRHRELALAERRPFEIEFRCVLADGRLRTLLARVVPMFSEVGEPLQLIGTTQDITDRKQTEERLKRSEALLAQAEEMAKVGSWEEDLRSGRTILSKQLLRMYGLSSENEWEPERYWENLQVSGPEVIRERLQRAVAACEPYEFVAGYRLPDGRLRVYHTKTLPIVGEDAKAERVLGMVHDITEQTRTEEDLHRLSQDLMLTQDSERRQLARELHESAGQSLAAVKMTLGNLEEVLPEGCEAARELLQNARGLAEDAVREVRVFSYLLHPPLLDDLGLIPALQWYVGGFSERSGIKATVELRPGFGRHSQEIETTIFRIVQEALTNVHRYSGSKTVRVLLEREPGKVRAEIQDEGCGLPMVTPRSGAGLRFGVGIAGMRERVKQLNGSLEIESTPGRGTTVRAILPLRSEGTLSDSVPRTEQGHACSKSED